MTNLSAKAIIDFHNGTVELEGSAEFVGRYLDRLEPLFERLGASRPEITSHNPLGKGRNFKQQEGAEADDSADRQRRRTVKRKGLPSCADRIRKLKEDGFFSGSRNLKAVTERLSELATPYARNQVAAALTQIVKVGDLRRLRANDGTWAYVEP